MSSSQATGLMGLWTPDSAAAPERHKYACTACGAKFKAKERRLYLRHMAMCSEAFAPEIEEMAAKRRDNIFLDGSLDPDRVDWLAKQREDSRVDLDDFKEGLIH